MTLQSQLVHSLNDHSLQKCFKLINENETKTIELLESNLKKAGEWMCQNGLKLNPGKWNTLHLAVGNNSTNAKLTQ